MSDKARFRLGRIYITLAFSWGWWMFGVVFQRNENAVWHRKTSGTVSADQYIVTLGIMPFIRVELVWLSTPQLIDKRAARRLRRKNP